MLLRQFYADIFVFSDMQERGVHSETQQGLIDCWLRARAQGTPQLEFPAADGFPCHTGREQRLCF